MNLFRIVMSAALLSAPVFACTEADDDLPDYVVENEPIETELGYFTLELAADSGQQWPQSTGPTALAIHVKPGPDPAPNDPELNGGAKDLLPPFALTLGEPRPWDGSDGPTIVADAPEAVTPDGFKWRVMCDFAVRGDWVIPITVTDFTDRSDSVDVVFHID